MWWGGGGGAWNGGGGGGGEGECCLKLAAADSILTSPEALSCSLAACSPVQLKARCQSVSFFLSPTTFFTHTVQTLPSDHLRCIWPPRQRRRKDK